MSLMGLDVGITGTKAVVFDPSGRILGQAYSEYPLHRSRPGWAELDAREVWQKVQAVISQAVAQAGGHDPVRALAVSCQGEAAVPLDKDGDILANTPVSFDARTIPQAEWFAEQVGAEEVFQITGQPLHPMYTLLKLMWFRENLPALAQRIRKFLCFEDFVMHQLGCSPCINYSLAARTMAFDIRSKTWSARLLNEVGIDAEVFARPMPSGEVIGEVSEGVAEAIGLPKGVQVVTGGHDQPAGAFGAGIIRSGLAVDGTGTVECITPAFSEPVLTPGMLANSYCCSPHVERDMYVTLAFNFTGGALLRWFRDTLGQAEVEEAARTGADPYDLIIARATPGPVDLLVLPHFTSAGTPWFDPKARGVIFGLTLGTGRGDLIKAILDGVTFEMRLNLELLDQAGVHIRQLRAIGGGAKSKAWLQLKADIFGRPVAALDVTEAPCLGTAMLAGVAIGEYNSSREAVEACVREHGLYEPDPGRHEAYTERFQLYKELYPRLKDLAHRMA